MTYILDVETVVYYDIDDTLVLHEGEPDIEVEDPYIEGFIHKLKVHKSNLTMLKRSHKRGYAIILWSWGGVKWAEAVMKALKIENLVTAVIPKLIHYSDDVTMKDWMIQNIYASEDYYG